jgi:hypothetical protein
MKRALHILLIIFILVAITAICLRPVILFLVQQQLKGVFIHSKVSIKSCNINPLKALKLSDIQIAKADTYDIKISEVQVEFSPSSLLRRRILKFSLRNVAVVVDLGKRNIFDFVQEIKLPSGGLFIIDAVELSSLDIRLNSDRLNLKALISCQLDLPKKLIHCLDAQLASFEGFGINLHNAYIKVCQKSYQGIFRIGEIKYNKLLIGNIESKAALAGSTLSFESLSADLLGGKLQAGINLKLGQNPEYLFDLKFLDIDLHQFANDFNLNEKVEMTGRVGGSVTLKGSAAGLKILSGDFNAAAPGGALTIKDQEYLKKIAAYAGQSLDLLVESFKNYHYNTGVMSFGLKERSLILDINLEGEAGKRKLEIILHNFP